MTYVGSWKIDDLLTFYANTQVFATGVATDADSAPAYRVYEDETGTPILTGTMALLDSANTAGFYSEQITLSAANGFEKGKSYSIYISAAVSSVAGATHRTFQMQAEVAVASMNANTVTATAIAADAITAAKVADGTIDAATFAAGAINAAAIADNAIDAGAIAADAITATKIATGAITAAKFAAGAIDAAAIATDAIDADAIKEDAITEIQNGLATPTNITAGIITTVTNLTNAPTSGDLTATMKTSVTTAATAATPTAAAVTGAVGSVTAGVTVTTNNDKTGYGLSAAAVQAIWDALTSALTTVGSIGKLLVDNINATISSRLASASYTTPPTVAEIRTELDSNSTKLANLDATISSRTKPADTQAAVTLVATTTNLTNLPATAALEATLTAMKGATFNGATDSLEAIRDRGDAAWTTATGFSTHSASDVWAVGTRLLTAGTNIVLAKGVGVTGFNDLSSSDVRAAVGLGSANLDTQLTTINNKTVNLPSDPADASDIVSSFAAIAAAISALNNISASDVWSFGTRILTAGTNIVLVKGTGVTGFNDLSAAQVNAEADTALADYDGPTNTELTTALGTADDAVLTQVATANSNILLVKTTTDKFTFTVPNQVDANIQSVNDVTVTGNGTPATPWGP